MKKGVQLAKRLSPSLSTILNLNASTHSLLSSCPWWSASQHRGVKVNAIHVYYFYPFRELQLDLHFHLYAPLFGLLFFAFSTAA
ncbi:hypothetical protein Gohar_023201 [Gossypium harknessii]|uniref:Uncharacterized protein n=1 Tax=Gossypium harknessii TaxID=34285 RepID=A0A7J9HD99_9ROSI|nr:hypothetical protein [Gossypium harknessii]